MLGVRWYGKRKNRKYTKKKIIRVLWTGGWDSRYRII